MAPPSHDELTLLGAPAEIRERIYDFLLPLQIVVLNLLFREIIPHPEDALNTFLSVRALCRTTYNEVKRRGPLIRYYIAGSPFDRPPLLPRFCLGRLRSLVLNIGFGAVPELLSTRHYVETSLPLLSWIQLYQSMELPRFALSGAEFQGLAVCLDSRADIFPTPYWEPSGLMLRINEIVRARQIKLVAPTLFVFPGMTIPRGIPPSRIGAVKTVALSVSRPGLLMTYYRRDDWNDRL